MPRWTPEARAAQSARARQTQPWTKSTGPRTAAGKAKSAANSLKTGAHTFQRRAERQALNAIFTAHRRWLRRLNRFTHAQARGLLEQKQEIELDKRLTEEGINITVALTLASDQRVIEMDCFHEISPSLAQLITVIKQHEFGKAMATVGGLTAVSRIAGFIRDIMTAAFLGGGPVADAFIVALKLPNFFRNITAEGAFSVSFVPLYTKTLHAQGEEGAARFAGQAASVMTCFLAFFTTLIVIFMPYLMFLIAPGFHSGNLRYQLAVEFSRITFPYLLLISLCSLLGGMLNAHEKFGPFASTSVYFNLCQIIAMLIAKHFFPSAGHALAWAVTLSGIIQLVRLAWYLRKYKIPLHLTRPRITPDVKRLFQLMVPGLIGAGIIHINLFADIVIASRLSEGGISALYYADRLFQLPLGIVGIAIGTALLPLMTKALTQGNEIEAQGLFNRALEYCLLMTVPAAFALAIGRVEIITVLFQHGIFTTANTARCAPALAFLALSLPPYVAVKIFSSAYWSRQDTKTPVRVASSMAVFNIIVAWTMTHFIDAAGLSFATALAGFIQCYFLSRGLRGHVNAQFDERLKRAVPRIFAAGALMGLVVFAEIHGMHAWFFGREIQKLSALGILVATSMLVYFSAAHFMHVLRLDDLQKYFRRRTPIIVPQSEQTEEQ